MELYDYECKFYEFLDNGESRRNGIKRALDTALERQDIENAFELYYEFIKEDIFYCNGYQSIIIFPECLALFEKYPEYQKKHQRNMMWSYKWIIGSFMDFYQIPIKQVNDIFNQYKDFCTRFNYSKRSYYRQIWNFLYSSGIDSIADVTDIKDSYNKMLKCHMDGLSEVPAGECDDAVEYILFVEKDIDKALKKAQPIFSGKLECNVVPHYTYVNFAIYYFENGDLTNAKLYIQKAYRVLERDFGNSPSLIYYKSRCIMFFSYIDVTKALKMFKKQLVICYFNNNGRENFNFYLSAYHVMLQLEKIGQKTVHLKFPDKSDPIYNEKGIYFVNELKDFMYSKAKFYADKFDERNRNSKYNTELAKQYKFDEEV